MLVLIRCNDEVGQPSFDVYHGYHTTRSTAVARVYDGRRTTRKKSIFRREQHAFHPTFTPFFIDR